MKTALTVGMWLSWMAVQALAAVHYDAVQQEMGIPSAMATVVDAAGEHPQIILIQDIHRHPEAQENIRAMILYGLKHWATHNVYLEGAWVSGQTQDFSFEGLEDEALYRKNVAAYEAVEERRVEALRELETARIIGRAFDTATPAPSWNLLRRLLQLHLKPAEYEDYLKHPFQATTPSTLARAVSSAEHFYEIANERSHIFLEKADALRPGGPKIIVVGGFHTAEMTHVLRDQGIPYVVLAPQVTQGGFEGLYSQGMQDTISALKLRSTSASPPPSSFLPIQTEDQSPAPFDKPLPL